MLWAARHTQQEGRASAPEASVSSHSISPHCFTVFKRRSIGAPVPSALGPARRSGARYPNGVSSERSAYASKRKAGPEVP